MQDDVIRIWHHVGQTIEHQLDHKKGTRIERVGTFTLDIKGRPIFAFQVMVLTWDAASRAAGTHKANG